MSISISDISALDLNYNDRFGFMNLYEKSTLWKRSLVETINNELKNACNIRHTRHRPVDNFAANLVA